MTIVVGGKELQMHRGLLCFHSAYFKKLLDGPFKEGGSNTHTLKDVSSDTFTMFYNWAYTGIVMDSNEVADTDLNYFDIIHIYEFADFHVVAQLKNRALELYFSKFCKDWSINILNSAMLYEKTAESSSLRRLHTDQLLQTWDFEDWRNISKDVPKDFIEDLFDRCREQKAVPGSLFGVRKGRDTWIKEMAKSFCTKYHEHVDLESSASIEITS